MEMIDNNYLSDKQHIEALVKELNLEEAKIKLDKMIKVYTNKADLYDLYSEVLLSLNYTKEAKAAIEKSISLEPESNGDKYMTLGQLLDKPRKKLECYYKGVEVYKKLIQNNNDNTVLFTISSALSSIAELYMTTELCEESTAEESCEKCLQEAYQICEINPDVLIQYSNLRILRAKDKEAKQFMDRAFELILSSQNTDNFPDTDIIFNLAKNYSELEDYYSAIKILDIITQLDDENLEYWYHLAFNHFRIKNYIHAQSCLDNLNEIKSKIDYNDKELMDGVKELQQELKSIEKKEGKLTNNLLEKEDSDDNEEQRNNNSMNIDY